jgi:Domain of unknown function (DUF4157)
METARAPAKQSAPPPAAAAATTRRTGGEPTVVPGAQAAMRQVSGPSVRLGTETTPPVEALPEETAKTVSGTGLGQPLPQEIRQALEKNFGASLEKVRVHTDTAATRAAQSLSARAFTYGNHIFLGPGEKPTDLALIAHEAAHIVQQRGAPVVQRFDAGHSNAYEAEAERASAAALRQEPFNVRERTSGFRVQRLGKSDALDFFADAANAIPGFRMFTIIIGVNPINMSHVEASPANILRAVIEFIPGGGLITEALDKYGIFDKVGNFVAEQLHSLGMTGSVIKQAINEFLDSLSWTDIFDLDDVWARAKRIFTEPIDRIVSFVEGLASGIIKLIKDAVLMPLAALASETRGWDLLIAILGKNPITDEDVPQDAETLIGGFLKLINQDAVFQTMKEARAVPRAIAWFQSNMGTLLGFVQQIPSLAINAFNALELEDLVLLPRAFKKVAAVFGNFIGDFVNWAGKALWDLLELIFDVVSPGALGYIKKTGAALKSILKNPLPFVGNLVKAAKLGFQNFASNIGEHFKAGLLDWLTGSLPGVYIPKSFALGEVVKLVFSVLGLTWANIRAKIVKVIGEPAMQVLEKVFDVVVTLVTQGPAAAWEQIKEQLSTLKNQIIDAIVDMVIDMVKKKAVPKIVAMFIPGAGFISAIISIYDTVMVFVQKLSKIIQVVTSFVNSIVAIASGDISGAAKRVERTLAGLLSLAINFLAGFAGLGKVADKVMGIIQKVRATVDKAIDWLVNWIVTTAKKLFAKLFQKDKPGDVVKKAGQAVVSRLSGGHTDEEIQTVVNQVKQEFAPQGLKQLYFAPPDSEGNEVLMAEASPATPTAKKKKKKPTVKTAYVVMTVKIVFDKDALKEIEEGKARETGRPVEPLTFRPQPIPEPRKEPVPGGAPSGMQMGALIGAPPPGQHKYGTTLIQPTAGAKEATIMTWNSGEPKPESNASHAERFFESWFTGHRLRNMKEIHVNINYSPCSFCASDFPSAPVQPAILTYGEAYEGRDKETGVLYSNTTTTEDIGVLKGKEWDVRGGSPKWTRATREEEIKKGKQRFLEKIS